MIATNQLNWAHFIAGQSGSVSLSMGPPGSAKTAMHEALARAKGRRFQALRLNELIPEDIGGFPIRSTLEFGGKSYEVMRRLPDERLMRCLLEPTVLMIDELTTTGGSMQAAALQLMNEGVGKYLALLAGDASLYDRDRTWIFAAANPVELAASGVNLTKPMVNRLWIGKWHTDFDAWHEGMENGGDFPAPNVPVLPDNWTDFVPHWTQLVSRFCRKQPQLREVMPEESSEGEQPYPTIRSWYNLARALAAGDSVNANPSTMNDLAQGFVGEGTALQFMEWLSQQDIPDPESILANPSSLVLPRRGDQPLAILGAIATAVKRNRTEDRWESFVDVLEVAYDTHPEYAISYLGIAQALKPTGYLPKKRASANYREMVKLAAEQGKVKA